MTWAHPFAALASGTLLAATLLRCQPQPISRPSTASVAASASAAAPHSSVATPPHTEPERAVQAIDWSEPVEPETVNSALRLTRAVGALQPPPRCATLLVAAPSRPSCDTPERAREQLAQALAEISSALLGQEKIANECRNDVEPPQPQFTPARKVSLDARLRVLESCTGLPPGFVRTLRAELTLDCADVLAENALASGTKFAAKYQHALFGLALAARFARPGPQPPAFRPREKLAEAARPFVERMLLPWLNQREAVLSELEASASRLPEQSYGGALARVAGALARLQMHDAYRGISIPIELKKDYRLRTSFYSVLNEAFTPFEERETRARHAAHRLLDVIGSIWLTDPFEVRPLLRDTAESLSQITLPKLAPPSAETIPARLALSLPPFYVPDVLSDAELRSPDVLRAALLRGLSPATRTRLRFGTPDSNVLAALARSELQAALLTSSPERARRAALLAQQASEQPLLLAVAQSLGTLPDALEAWNTQSPLPVNVASLAHFDVPQRDHVGLARLNAALLLIAARRFDEAQSLVAQITLPEPISTICRESAFGQSLRFLRNHCPCPYVWSRPLEGQRSPLAVR